MAFDFEQIHRNHKFAFLDGLLCGLVISYFAYKISTDVKMDRDLRHWAEDDDQQ